jgi:uncharacterized iron-regulated membrane protein
VFYSFEIQMLGVILLPVMAAVGIILWFKRRKARKELEMAAESDDTQADRVDEKI